MNWKKKGRKKKLEQTSDVDCFFLWELEGGTRTLREEHGVVTRAGEEMRYSHHLFS